MCSLKPPKSRVSKNSKKSYYLTAHLAFLQPYLNGGDTSGNLDVEDTATEKSNTNQNDGSETLVEREMSDKAFLLHRWRRFIAHCCEAPSNI